VRPKSDPGDAANAAHALLGGRAGLQLARTITERQMKAPP